MSIVTQELINQAKEKHGEVFVLEVNLSEKESLTNLAIADNDQKEFLKSELEEWKPQKGSYYAVLSKPTKLVIGFAMTHRDPIRMGNAILDNSVVELEGIGRLCDQEIIDIDDANITAALEACTFVNIGTSNLKKY